MVDKASARKRDDVRPRKRDNTTPPKGPGSPECFKGKSRGPGRSSFNVPDLKKAMTVVAERGGHLELRPGGHISIIPAGHASTTPAGNDLDEWVAKKNARPA
jgi:hypothetical protein